MSFTKKEGSDDTRDVVAQRAVNLPYMTQTRGVTGGVLTTDKASDGAGGSWTRLTLEPNQIDDPGETSYVLSTICSRDQLADKTRITKFEKFAHVVFPTSWRRSEIVKLVALDGSTRLKIDSIHVDAVDSADAVGLTVRAHTLVSAGLFLDISTGDATSEGNPVVIDQLVIVRPVMGALYFSNISFQHGSYLPSSFDLVPIIPGLEEGVVTATGGVIVSGYTKGNTGKFGISSVHIGDIDGFGYGIQQLRYGGLSVNLLSKTAPVTKISHPIYTPPRGTYHCPADVTRVSKTDLIAVAHGLVQYEAPLNDDSVQTVNPSKVFWSSDNGVNWTEISAPNWDFTNYVKKSVLVNGEQDTGSTLFPFIGDAGRIRNLTFYAPWKKDEVLGISLFYDLATSASGGEYRLFSMKASGSSMVLTLPIDAYKYRLEALCRPIGAIVATFRASAHAVIGNYLPPDAVYPLEDIKDVDDAVIFRALNDSGGYADYSTLAVYDKNGLHMRPLPWTRELAPGHVFCVTNELIGTVVFQPSEKYGRSVYWLYTSKDLGINWKKAFVVDHLADSPSFETDHVVLPSGTAIEVVYKSDSGYYSYPPRSVIGVYQGGEPTFPYPGATWLNN